MFSTVDDTVTAAAAGKDQKLTVDCKLSAGFAYILVDWSACLEDGTDDGDTLDWSDHAALALNENHDTAASSIWVYNMGAEKPAIGLDAGLSTSAEYRPYNPRFLTKLLIPSSTGAKLQFVIWNLTIDGGAMTFTYFARFLQFDLNQAYRAIVNTPVPVR